MQIETNKAIIRRYYQEVVNEANFAVLPDLVAPKHTADVHQLVTMLHTAFPDFHVTLEDLIAEADKVVALFTATGTHQGECFFIATPLRPDFYSFVVPGYIPSPHEHLFTIPGSNKVLAYHGVRVFTLADGKIANVRGGWSSYMNRFSYWASSKGGYPFLT